MIHLTVYYVNTIIAVVVEYKIEKYNEGEYSNGVKWGSVPTSSTKTKRNGGHTWFPDSWDDDKIITEMYRVKNGKSEFIMDKVNDDGKLLGQIYNCDNVAVVYRKNEKGDTIKETNTTSKKRSKHKPNRGTYKITHFSPGSASPIF